MKKYLLILILGLLLVSWVSAASIITYPTQFNQSVYVKNYIGVLNDTTTAPDASSDADTLRQTVATNQQRYLYQSAAVTNGVNYTSSVYMKMYGTDITHVQLTHSYSLFGEYQWATFDLSSGTIVTQQNCSASITNVGSGWYWLKYTATATSSGTGPVFVIGFTNNNASLGRLPYYTSSSLKYIYAWGAQSETGDTATAFEEEDTCPPTCGTSGNRTIAAGYKFFPSDTLWYQQINTLPVHTQSASYIAGIKTVEAYALPSHPATRNNLSLFIFNGAEYFVVNNTIDKQYLMNRNMSTGTAYGSSYYRTRDTDLSAEIPIPDDMTWMVGGSDAAVNLVDPDDGIIYQLGQVSVNGTGYNAYPAIWNMSSYLYRFSADESEVDNGNRWLGNTYTQRIDPTTKSRYAKIPTFHVSMSSAPTIQSLIRHEEVVAGSINHSIGVTLYAVNGTATWPALGSGHWGETSWMGWTNNTPPCGAHARLKSSYNVETSGMGTYAKVVARAMQTYGVWITDNGCYYSMCLLGANNTAWNTSEKTDMQTLTRLTIDDFEWVDISSLMLDRYSMQANVSETGTIPSSSFTRHKTVVRIPATTWFNDTSTNTPTGWSWTFGDGTTSTDQHPTKKYYRPGRYTVTLTASNGEGSGIPASSYVWVIGGGGGSIMLPKETPYVSLEQGTYTASRELTDSEDKQVLENMIKMCEELHCLTIYQN